LPDRSRELATRAGLFFKPALDGGLPLSPLFNPRRRSSSGMHAQIRDQDLLRGDHRFGQIRFRWRAHGSSTRAEPPVNHPPVRGSLGSY
jgi:hypothetical protein